MLSKRILVLMFVVAFLPLLVGCFPAPTPPNETPIITSDPITTATVGVTYVYDVNATDPDGDTLTYSLITKPTGMTINSANGLIKWIPVTAQIGNNAVTVGVSDGDLSVVQSFDIKVSKPTPVNQAPIIYSTPITTATVGVTYVYDVNATDPDGDTLTYSLITKPTGMTINSANGLIMWTPTVKGSYAVVVNASDGALSDTQGFTVTVTTVEPEPEPEPEIELTRIEVSPDTMDLLKGDSQQLTVTAIYSDGSTASIVPEDCIYTSSATSVATVSDGVVTGVSYSEAVITVSYREEITKTAYIEETDTVTVTVIGPVHNLNTNGYYDTIQGAVDLTSAGDTIKVMAGTYTPLSTIVIDKNNLTLIGPQADVDPRPSYGSPRTSGSTEEAVIDGGMNNLGMIICINADNVVVNGFEIKSGTSDMVSQGQHGTDYEVAHSGTVIKYNIVHNSTIDEGVQLKQCDNGVIEYNYVYDTAGDALNFADSDDCVIQFNEICNADDRTTITWGGAIYTYNSTNIDIIGNRIYSTCSHGIVLGGVKGYEQTYYSDKMNDGGKVEGNIINVVVGDGLVLVSNNTTVEDNEIYGCIRGIQIVGENIEIQNNNLHDNDMGISVHEVSVNISANNNNIMDNSSFGMVNNAAEEVDATNNWWGSGGADSNAGKPGEGGNNDVSANVDFEPWSTSSYPH